LNNETNEEKMFEAENLNIRNFSRVGKSDSVFDRALEYFMEINQKYNGLIPHLASRSNAP
jgi:hypothetical protein